MKQAISIYGLLPLYQACVPSAPKYPYENPEKVMAEGQRISDSMEWYIKAWVDGRVPAPIQ